MNKSFESLQHSGVYTSNGFVRVNRKPARVHWLVSLLVWLGL